MDKNELLDRIRRTVQEMEPEAEVFLFGSRARRDAQSESDWDLLILVKGPVSFQRKSAIRHRLYEIEWEPENVISAIIKSREEWNSNYILETGQD